MDCSLWYPTLHRSFRLPVSQLLHCTLKSQDQPSEPEAMGTTCENSNPVFYESQAHVVLIIRAIGEESSLKEQFCGRNVRG